MSQNRPKSRVSRKKNPKGAGTFGTTKDGLPYYKLGLKGQKRRTVYSRTDIVGAAIRLQQEMGSPLAPVFVPEGTLATLWERHLAHLRHEDLPLQTLRGTRSAFACHILPLIGHIALADLSETHVRYLTDQMVLAGSAPASVSYVLGRLRKTLLWAQERRELASNPAQALHVTRRRKRPVTVLSAAELSRLVSTSASAMWGPAWRLLADSGIRLGELLGLEQSGVDWEQGQIRISQQVEAGRLGPLKTPRAYRRITLAPTTVTALRAWQRASGPLLLVDGRRPVPNTVRKAFRKALVVADLSPVGRTPHTLRHTCATLLLESGVNVRVVSDRLGHASVQTTLSLYGHVLPSMESHAQAVIERLLS